MYLMEYMKEHQGELESAPLGICAVAARADGYIREQIDEGVIFCLKLLNDKIHTANYALDPYYLVYVSKEGEIMFGHTRAKKILDLYKKLCKGQHSAVDEAVALFHKETKRGKEMSSYQSLFREVVDSFYADITSCIVALEVASLGAEFSTEDIFEKKPIIDKINKLNDEIISLKSAIKKESQFNAKVRLNMRVKSLEEEIRGFKNRL